MPAFTTTEEVLKECFGWANYVSPEHEKIHAFRAKCVVNEESSAQIQSTMILTPGEWRILWPSYMRGPLSNIVVISVQENIAIGWTVLQVLHFLPQALRARQGHGPVRFLAGWSRGQKRRGEAVQ